MSESPSTNPYVINEPERIGSADDPDNCARLVLAVYTAVIASSRSERRAFNAAVETYRGENADLREAEARLAVARIICSKP